MKKGEIYEGVVEQTAFPNKGYITVEGERVLVKNTLPGQKVRFQINKKRSGRAEGRLLDVLAPSPLAGEASLCGIFPACGGCLYQTLPYEEQLGIKEGHVKELLDAALTAGGQTSDYVYDGIRRSPSMLGYRNKMEFSFGDEVKGGPLTLGLHKRGTTYDVLTAADCKLVHPDMTKILSYVLDYFTKASTAYYHKITHVGYLRHLLIRRSETSGEILAALVTTSQETQDLTDFANGLRQLALSGSLRGILHVVNDSLADIVRSDHTEILYGTDSFHEKVLGLSFKITPFSFFQTNTRGAEVLYTLARDYIKGALGADKTVFDLYSGTGTIAQLLSPVAGKVIGVEIVEEAVAAAVENAEANGLSNCSFIAGDVLRVLDEVEEKPDVIVLDPPREGIHPKALPKIIAYGVEKIVYISCKPTSLARDLGTFFAGGYKARRIGMVDMFPYTPHVECVVLMSKVQK